MSVEIRDETIELLTYVWGPPDPNPPFQRSGSWSIYPYSLLDDIGEEARPLRYRALVVENEYLRVTVLPELGGRIYSALDKPTGEEMFYRNNVVKPGLIGLRGAWISGGVEFNFPRGHTVTTVSQVDGRVVQEADGSATIWVGNIEQIHRMAWAVGVRLRPASSRIETEILLTNHTSIPHPYYFWANAAVPAREDMRLIYPGTRAFTWRRPRLNWPIHEGKDMARYTAFEGGNDIFLIDSLEDFFGVYYEERDFGLVHVANVHDSFGKKFFTWGTAHHAKVWSAALSDSDGPYCEIQSGRFVNQATWHLMPPHHTERWLEYWYPVKGTSGFSHANREAAVRVSRNGSRLECGAVVTSPYPGAVVRVLVDDRPAHERQLDLRPDQPLRIELPEGAERAGSAVTMILLEAGGREIIRYTAGQPPRTVTLRDEVESTNSTSGERLRRALRAEQRGEREEAWELYEEVLSEDPTCVSALIAVGRIAIELHPEQAVARLEQAAAAAPESAEAAYYLGVALRRAGREQEAEVELWRAAHRPEFAHSARVEIGLIAMRRGEWEAAAESLRASLRYQPDDARSGCLLAAAMRRLGNAKEALEQVDGVLDRHSGDRFGAAEGHFCAAALGHPRVASRHLRQLQRMLPPESDPWLELALDYLRAGLAEEATTVLRWAMSRIPAVAKCPLAHYLLAHLLLSSGDADGAAAEQRHARSLSPELVFPHHWELEAVLREAVEQDPDDAHAHYYLGTLLYGQGRREEALAEWEAAVSGLPSFSVLHRSLAMAYRQVRNDLGRAENALRRAVECRASDTRLYLELNEVMRERGAGSRERLAVLDAAPASVQRRGTISAQQVTCCIDLEEWDRAIDLLTKHTFHRWEMEFRMRGLYVDAHLGRGTAAFDRGDLVGAREDFERALEYPMNLRIGRPARSADARAHWCAGVVCDALGDGASATSHWQAAAAESHHEPNSELAIYRALSLQKIGLAEEAEEVLGEALAIAQKCADMAPDDAMAQLSLGLALRAVGRNEEAGRPLRRALELHPGLSRARRLLEAEVIL